MKKLGDIRQEFLFKLICNKLRNEFGTLPTQGVIAGQSVASAVYEILGVARKGVFNDIDIFCKPEEMPRVPNDHPGRTIHSSATLSKRSAPVGADFFNSSFSTALGAIHKNFYEITGSFYDSFNPRYNYIEVRTAHNEHTDIEQKSRAYNIIQGFDVNCCQIAIDLKNGEVTWTPEFENFLYQKEIKTAYFGTPMHTAIRLLKKQDDLPWATLNVDEEMKKLQTARQVCVLAEKAREKGFIPGNIFSKVYLRRYRERADVLDKYFSIKSKTIEFQRDYDHDRGAFNVESKEFYQMNPKEYDEKTLSVFTAIHGQDRQVVSIQERNGESSSGSTETVIVERFDDVIANLDRYQTVATSNSKKSKKLRSLLDLVRDMKGNSDGKRFFLMNALYNPDFKYSGLQETAIQRVVRFVSKHPRCIGALSEGRNGLDINEIVKLIPKLTWIDKSEALHFIGEIERTGYLMPSLQEVLDFFDKRYLDTIETYKSIPDVGPESFEKAKRDFESRKDEAIEDDRSMISREDLNSENWKDIVKKKHEIKKSKMKEESTEPLFADLLNEVEGHFHGKVKITEISSHWDQYMEGSSMRHCVGGYWPNNESGQAFFFHIDQDVDGEIKKSTLMISPNLGCIKKMIKDDYIGATINQHYGVGNQSILEEEEEVGRFLCHKIGEILADSAKKMSYALDTNKIEPTNDLIDRYVITGGDRPSVNHLEWSEFMSSKPNMEDLIMSFIDNANYGGFFAPEDEIAF